jgi:phage-related protein
MWSIIFYKDHRGKCPPLEFINELPAIEQAFYFAYVERRFVILHGYRKQGMKAPEREIMIALRRMNELLDEV